MKLPSRKYCEQLFIKYKVPENIKNHCYKVNQIAVFLAKKLSEAEQEIDIELVDRLSLLHDLMKAVALKKLDKNPLFKADPTAEEIEMCVQLKKQFHGMHETQITSAILKEEYPEFAKCIESEGNSGIFTSQKRIEEQIVHYADWRVFADEIIPLQKRIDDLFKRYNEKIMTRGIVLWKKRVADELAVEKQLFNKLTIKPEDLKTILGSDIKLIMFDYDGTLMDTFTLTCHIYNEIFRQFKIDKSFTKRQFQELFESDWRNCLKKLGLIKPEDWQKCFEIYNTITIDFEDEIRCYPHIEEILQELHRKYKLAIISNGKKELIIIKLKKYNLLKYFDYIAGSEDGEKPSPEPLLKCMQKLKVPPNQSSYVGDMDGDIIAGKAAKVQKVVAVSYGYHHHSRLQEADVIINKPNELLDIFK